MIPDEQITLLRGRLKGLSSAASAPLDADELRYLLDRMELLLTEHQEIGNWPNLQPDGETWWTRLGTAHQAVEDLH